MGCSKPSKHEVKERADSLNQELLDTIQFLRSTPMFRNLSPHEYPMLVAACEVRVYARGNVVVWEGEFGRELFVIKSGKAHVYTMSLKDRRQVSKVSNNTSVHSPGAAEEDLELEMATSSALVGETRRKSSKETNEHHRTDEPIRITSFTGTGSQSLGLGNPRRSSKDGRGGSKDSRASPGEEFGTKVASLHPRDYFGERALIFDELWDGTIVAASEELSCVVVSQEKFQDLYARGKVHVPKRRAVAQDKAALEAGAEDDAYDSERSGASKTVTESPMRKCRQKTDEEVQLVVKALKNSSHLTVLLDHPGPSRFEAFAKVAWRKEVAKGEYLQQPWSPPILYVVQEGMLEARGFTREPNSTELGFTLQNSWSHAAQCSIDLASFQVGVPAATKPVEDHGSSDDVSQPANDEWSRLESHEAEIQIGPGSCIGEHALIFEAKQPGTVQAIENSVVWALDRSDYDQALFRISKMWIKERMDLLDQVDVFAPLLSAEKRRFVKAMGQEDFKKGQVICKEDDVEATFFILYRGEVLVESNGHEVARLDGSRECVKSFGKGQLLAPKSNSLPEADASLLSSVTVTVLSTDGATCLTLAREFMDAILDASQDQFGQPPDFQACNTEISNASTAKWTDSPPLSRRGSAVSARRSRTSLVIDEDQLITHVVQENPLLPFDDAIGKQMPHATPQPSEMAWEHASRRSSRASSGGNSPPIMAERKSDRKSSFASAISSGLSSMLGKEPASVQKAVKQGRPVIQMKDLKQLITIGKGAFGTVHLVVHKPTKKMYALKKVRKAKVVAHNMKSQILNEKCILEIMHSLFITRLIGTFRTDQEVLFLIEAALGGDLYSVYWKHRLFGEKAHARFYTASVVCALEHMHERYVIYRDMKPENLLIDDKGRLKVTDFGLSKFVVGTTFTVCGTPVFFAPEIVQRAGYTQAVDWWALGILTWEFFVGHPPFHAQREGEVLLWLFNEKMLQGISKPKYPWPQAIPEEARSFFISVLNFKPDERLPMKLGGKQKLKELAWFKDFSWQDLVRGSMVAPYLPPKLDIKNPGALGYDSGGLTRAEDEATYEDDGTGWDLEFG